MKRIFFLVLISIFSVPTFGQMAMSVKGINPDNICKPNKVYFLITDKPRPKESIDSIEVRINNFVKFVKENPTYEASPSVQLAVNCRGEIGGGFHNVIISKNEDLDRELVEFFKTVTAWRPGKIKKKSVDSWYTWRMEIKNGLIDILNE